MNMKSLFGNSLFGFKKPLDPMYDFAQHGLLNATGPIGLEAYVAITNGGQLGSVTEKELKKKMKKEATKPTASPKKLFELKALHQKKFTINTDPAYLDDQISQVKAKLDLMGKKPKEKQDRWGGTLGGEWGGQKFSRMELESILERFENRKKIDLAKTILKEYPHTTSDKINEIIKAHSNLYCELAASFIPDFPKDAIDAMTEYNATCEKLCGRKSIFYVLAERKNAATKGARRDPILFAQSPFGFFWQILGAWDKEMVYLADL